MNCLQLRCCLLALLVLTLGCAEGQVPDLTGDAGLDSAPARDSARPIDLARNGDAAAAADLGGGKDGGPQPSDGPLVTCNDQVKNGGESDIDCGGKCPACTVDRACNQDADCASGRCVGQKCALPPGLAAAVSYPAMEPDDLVAGDFNGDGKLDLATANRKIGGCVLINRGDGTFKAPSCTPAGKFPGNVAVGDWNGDQRLDLALANANGNDVSLLAGKGDGSFAPAVAAGSADYPHGIVGGDWNGDGKLDLALASTSMNPLGGDATILLGKGDLTFQPASREPTVGPLAIVAGDWNGDGKGDLAVVNLPTMDNPNGSMSLLVNRGNGAFQAAAPYAAGKLPNSLATGDWNGDGKVDLAVTNRDSDDASVFIGNGDGTFQAAMSFPCGHLPGDLTAADLNRDGRLDLAVADFNDTLSLLYGKGDGTFQAPIGFPVQKSPRAVVAGDWNGDGKVDLAVANSSSGDIAILINTAP